MCVCVCFLALPFSNQNKSLFLNQIYFRVRTQPSLSGLLGVAAVSHHPPASPFRSPLSVVVRATALLQLPPCRAALRVQTSDSSEFCEQGA